MTDFTELYKHLQVAADTLGKPYMTKVRQELRESIELDRQLVEEERKIVVQRNILLASTRIAILTHRDQDRKDALIRKKENEPLARICKQLFRCNSRDN